MLKDKLKSLVPISRDILIFPTLSNLQKRNASKPVDKVAGLIYLFNLLFIQIYDAEESADDAWRTLVAGMNGVHRTQLLSYMFLYPKAGDGSEAWRPSWQQIMEDTLPKKPVELRIGLQVSVEISGCWHCGPRIDACRVRGLADASEHPRYGELIVKNNSGVDSVECTIFRIVANHACSIGDGQYTLLGVDVLALNMWVVGTIEQPEGKFMKVSVFSMVDDEEAKRLMSLNVHKKTKTSLL